MTPEASSAAIRLSRRWVRNYTGRWHLGWPDTRRTYCAVRIRAEGLQVKRELDAGDVPCGRCSRIASPQDATADAA